jgi:hypothetical protein
MLEMPGLLGDNAVANKNPQYFQRLPSRFTGVDNMKVCFFLSTSAYHTLCHLLREMP